uniref:RAB11 family interacting protein 2 n=1 Tax=Pavo cristatus TaxID=9049 RepID=A0A8C9EJU7_PAVCR
MMLAEQAQKWFPTHVQVTVLQAKGLKPKGKSGTNDAYTIIQLGKEKYSTSVAEKTLDPVWKEEASFELPGLLMQENPDRYILYLIVMHRSLVGLDKFLGQVAISLNDVFEDKQRRKTELFAGSLKSPHRRTLSVDTSKMNQLDSTADETALEAQSDPFTNVSASLPQKFATLPRQKNPFEESPATWDQNINLFSKPVEIKKEIRKEKKEKVSLFERVTGKKDSRRSDKLSNGGSESSTDLKSPGAFGETHQESFDYESTNPFMTNFKPRSMLPSSSSSQCPFRRVLVFRSLFFCESLLLVLDFYVNIAICFIRSFCYFQKARSRKHYDRFYKSAALEQYVSCSNLRYKLFYPPLLWSVSIV